MAKRGPSIDDILELKHTFDPPLSIIPIKNEDKIPARPWRRVYEDGDLFSDDELRDIWIQGRHSPGLATGRYSGPGLVGVDADNQAGVDWCLKNLPPTPMTCARTQGRGHYYFPMDHDADEPRCQVDALGSRARWEWEAEAKLGLKMRVVSHAQQTPEELAAEVEEVERNREIAAEKLEIGPLIDIRGYGGQMVAPGAIHRSGDTYEMGEPWRQGMLDGVDYFRPDWFERWRRPEGARTLEGLRSKKVEGVAAEEVDAVTPADRFRRARAWLAVVEGAVSGQGGHNKAFYVANRLMVGFLLDEEEGFRLMKEEYNPRCQPPWSDEEIAHKIKSAARNRQTNPGFLLGDNKKGKLIRLVEVDHRAPETDEDVKIWTKLWDKVGVDYQELRADGCRWTPKFKAGEWYLPNNDPNNLLASVIHSRLFGHDLRWNVMELCVYCDGQRADDGVMGNLWLELSHLWKNSTLSDAAAHKVLVLAAKRRPLDPIKDWLESLPPWDGVERLTRVPAEVLGTPGCEPIHGQMWRRFMIGLAGRIIKPGLKVESMIFLVSKRQGTGKSRALRMLADGHLHGQGWFSDSNFSLTDKDGKMLVNRFMLIEWSESEHAKSAKMIDRIKGFLSEQDSNYRAPYGLAIETHPRRGLLCGTSNEDELIHDPSGSRRFFIIRTSDKIDLPLLKRWREQLFAEALSIYRRHVAAPEMSDEYHATRWWFEGEEDDEREAAVAEFQSQSAWMGDVERWLDDRGQEPFTSDDVIREALGMDRDRKSKKVTGEIKWVLQQLGCEYMGRKRVYGIRGGWWRVPNPPGVRDSQ